MDIYAVSDLHLSGKADKPMNVFGEGWEGHFEKIKKDWKEKVKPDDAVLIAGDISWGMRPEEGMYDVCSLAGLPGKKIFIRGNHDYWWNGITKIRAMAPDDSFIFLQNDCVRFDGVVICGSRGWACPGSADFKAEDEKIYLREGERFRLAFRAAQEVRAEGDKLIAMIHYPPFNAKRESSLYTDAFEKNNVDLAVYGHLHQYAGQYPLVCERGGIRYFLTSCDLLGFTLARVL